ncbi:MAG: polysaccharide deacetylase family protein [Nitrospira sp.]|nr:polysaccharide deacetylase family protein [Nitrospira sp.]
MGPLFLNKTMADIRSLIKRGFCSAIVYSGALSVFRWYVNAFEANCINDGAVGFPFVKRRREARLQILTYHRVNNERDSFFPATPISVFAEQMQFLAEHYHVVALETAVELLRKGDLPENSVAITFDDGYKDNYLHAFPILKRLGIPATIFLATGVIGTGRVLWHDQVFSAFRQTIKRALEGFGPQLATFKISSLQDKLCAQQQVLGMLRRCGEDARTRWICQLTERLEVQPLMSDAGLMLNWEQVKRMVEGGIAIGSHTMTHPIMSKISSLQVQSEAVGSMKAIQEAVGVVPRTFAYPNGTVEDFTPSVKAALREAGYVCAVTTIFGSNMRAQDPFELRRGGPWETHLPTFAVKMNWYRFCPY